MCDAVINGGAKQCLHRVPRPAPIRSSRTRSRSRQRRTSRSSSTPLCAARAAVRAGSRQLCRGASPTRRTIPDDFVFAMPYFTTDQDQYNRIFWATANQPYRAHTVWNTVYDQYYTDTKDPRVPWATDPESAVGDAAVLSLGRVTWHKEMKFAKQDAAINLSSGWEMRLIEAEAKLVGNDVAGAMTLINKHRASRLGLHPGRRRRSTRPGRRCVASGVSSSGSKAGGSTISAAGRPRTRQARCRRSSCPAPAQRRAVVSHAAGPLLPDPDVREAEQPESGGKLRFLFA